MSEAFLVASAVIGVVVFLVAWLSGRGNAEDTPPRFALPIAIGLPLVAFLLCLPTGKPFSAGQGLGIALLLGGVAGTLAGFAGLGKSLDLKTAAAQVGLATATVAVPCLFMRGSILDALMGVAMGWTASALTLSLATRPKESPAVALGIGVVGALAGAALISVLRDDITPELANQTWVRLLLATSTLGSLLLFGLSFVPAKGGGKFVAPLVLMGVLAVHLQQLGTKIAMEPRLLKAGVIGLVVGLVAMFVLAEAMKRRGSGTPLSEGLPMLSVLLVAAGFMAGFQVLQGFGAAIALLMMWLAMPVALAISAPDDERRDALANDGITLLLTATVFLLYRAFASNYTDDLRGVVLTDHYALFGLLVGIGLPGTISALPRLWREKGSDRSLLPMLLATGVLCLAAPAGLLLLFGPKIILALVIGLGIGTALPVARASGGGNLIAGILAVGLALTIEQFAHVLLPLTDATRAERIKYMAFLMAGVVAAVVGSEFVTRRATSSEEAK